MFSDSTAPARRRPLFLEVRTRFLAEVSEGRLERGERLPSEPDLAEAFGVSRPTMREVLRSLEADGVVRRVHGVGTFITRAEPLVRTALDLDVGVTEAVAAAHATLGIEVIRVSTERAEPWVAEALELPAGDLVFAVERLIRANGIPAVHGLDMIPGSLLEGREPGEYDGGSIYHFLEHTCRIQLVGGVAEVTAVAATRRLAADLGRTQNSPLLRLDQIEKSIDGRPVLVSREHYAPGVFSLMVRRLRHQRADESGEEREEAAATDKPQA